MRAFAAREACDLSLWIESLYGGGGVHLSIEPREQEDRTRVTAKAPHAHVVLCERRRLAGVVLRDRVRRLHLERHLQGAGVETRADTTHESCGARAGGGIAAATEAAGDAIETLGRAAVSTLQMHAFDGLIDGTFGAIARPPVRCGLIDVEAGAVFHVGDVILRRTHRIDIVRSADTGGHGARRVGGLREHHTVRAAAAGPAAAADASAEETGRRVRVNRASDVRRRGGCVIGGQVELCGDGSWREN